MRNEKISLLNHVSSPKNVVGDLPLTGCCKTKEVVSYSIDDTKEGDFRQRHSGMTAFFNEAAFTLIELLVVVLIIGILAAIAVPQYQKAVVKSRYSRLKPIVESLATAENIYYLANGEYTEDFTELDVDLPGGGVHADNLTAANRYDFDWGWCQVQNNSSEGYTSLYCVSTDTMQYQILLYSPIKIRRRCSVRDTNDTSDARVQLCQAETGKTKPVNSKAKQHSYLY